MTERKENDIANIDQVNVQSACRFVELEIERLTAQLKACKYRDVRLLNKFIELRDLLYYFKSLLPASISAFQVFILCL